MIVVRFVFAYMLALSAVEFLLLTGGMTSDKEFFLGAITAVPVTITWWMMPERRVVAAYLERMRATGLISRQPQSPASGGHARHRAAHGSSPSR